ncbi:transmembrane amino acid transporter protein-domain-containing protein [Kickxella alabastrina]|uniref:transmembrane amino acid transporter protein-domain-containing protein n=1 Tax=Kickxella alabastrina TaxID=61397 RepID=UPI00221F57B1|nr:transmembrane amino acid transporter protein-domain-containing protein [Kickxella alabastrina]KAI7825503.1 transmembrane amino acid transporter protein-domain-containing protein [Kickxella alabastrina]
MSTPSPQSTGSKAGEHVSSNAQRVSAIQEAAGSRPVSGSTPRSFTQETELLISGSVADDSDAPLRRPRSEMVLSEAEAARRLKRHLLTAAELREPGWQQRQWVSDENDGEDEGDSNRNASDDEEPVDPFTLPSGDITHPLYRTRRNHNRTRSFSAAPSDTEWGLGYTPDQILAPGGFRRQFVHERAAQQGRPANILTANFVDYMGSTATLPAAITREAGGDEEEGGAEERAALIRASKRQARDIRGTATPRKAFFLLIKSFVGTGILVLPRAFFNGGLVFSTVLMSAIAWYALHCMIMLYGDLALKLYGRPLKYCVLVSIVLAQLGFCCAYVIFVATNMQDLWNSLTGCRYQFSAEAWIVVQLLVYIPLSFVRKIKKFASISVIGNFFILVGLGYLFVYDFWSLAQVPAAGGHGAFSYEGISLVIPIVESMEHKEKFNKVLTSSLVICAGLFPVVLLNLPSGSMWTLGIQLLYSLAIIMSVPLQLEGNLVVKTQKNLFRTLVVVVVALVAVFGAEKLDNFIAIVGAGACIPLSFLFPPMLHYRVFANTLGAKIKDMA